MKELFLLQINNHKGNAELEEVSRLLSASVSLFQSKPLNVKDKEAEAQ